MSTTINLNIPDDISGWRDATERAKIIYWNARRDGADENKALLAVLDDCFRDEDYQERLREQQLDEADAINSRFAP